MIINDIDGKSDIWLIDVERNTRRRFTSTADDTPIRRSAINWSGNGEFIAYSVESDSATSIAIKRTDGSGGEENLLTIPGVSIWRYDISADSKWVLFGRQNEQGNEDLWIMPSNGEGDPRALFNTPYDEWPGAGRST